MVAYSPSPTLRKEFALWRLKGAVRWLATDPLAAKINTPEQRLDLIAHAFAECEAEMAAVDLPAPFYAAREALALINPERTV